MEEKKGLQMFMEEASAMLCAMHSMLSSINSLNAAMLARSDDARNRAIAVSSMGIDASSRFYDAAMKLKKMREGINDEQRYRVGHRAAQGCGGQGNPAGHGGAVLEERKEGMEMKEEAMAMSSAPTATIKLDSWWNRPERHGAMFDLAASEDVELREGEVKVIPLGIRMKLPEGYFGLVVPRSSTCLKHGIMMANSVGIIEPDYCGDSDVGGFVAYAIRDTVIAKGMRIAQFMPVPMFGDLDFDVVDSMPYADRGGYGSTGEKSAEVRTYRGANGLELHVGDYVIDEFGERYCVMGLHEGDGATAAYADLGNSRTPLEVAPCLSLRLAVRPHDCDGVPIEIGDVLYRTDPDGKPIGDPLEVDGYIDETFFAKGHALPMSGGEYTHREPPDSWEKLEEDALKTPCAYFGKLEEPNAFCTECPHGAEITGRGCIKNMKLDLIERAKRLVGVEEQDGGERTAIADKEER